MESPRSSSWIWRAPSTASALHGKWHAGRGRRTGRALDLPSALLAELLYERGETDEAERLLAESFKLGAEEGIVEMINARFVVGRAWRCCAATAAARSTLIAADIAERLSRPRLRASVEMSE